MIIVLLHYTAVLDKVTVVLIRVMTEPELNVLLLAALPVPHRDRCLKHVDEPAGKAAVIWMVGEYGDEMTVSIAPCKVACLASSVGRSVGLSVVPTVGVVLHGRFCSYQ